MTAEAFTAAVAYFARRHLVDGYVLILVDGSEAAITTGGCDDTAVAACEVMAGKLNRKSRAAERVTQ